MQVVLVVVPMVFTHHGHLIREVMMECGQLVVAVPELLVQLGEEEVVVV